MKHYTFKNTLISKKHLKEILAWTFTNYGSIQASFLADELKYLGFEYSTKAGISISIEDLKIPAIKNSILEKSNNNILKTEENYLLGKITEVERFQKVIDTWNITSETLKDEVVSYFRNYDPLNSVYMMAFSGARGNLSQVRQLVGMRGLMSDPNGEIMDLPIKQNFREGLTLTDYLMSGYGARKGIVDTALKTANSGYLTRRLIDVAQDIIIREKDCLQKRSVIFKDIEKDSKVIRSLYTRILGRTLNKSVYNPDKPKELLISEGTQLTPLLIEVLKKYQIKTILLGSPLTCGLNRSICQKCYGWDLAREKIIDTGEAVGIIAGQSIGEPGTQLTMRTFHTGGIFTAGSNQQIISTIDGNIQFSEFLQTNPFRTPQGEEVLQTENAGSLLIETSKQKTLKIEIPPKTILFVKDKSYINKETVIGQIIESSKQTKSEKKDVLSKLSGEILLKQETNNKETNKLGWVFSGELILIPEKAYLNFTKDLSIFKNSFVWRTKIVNKRPGFINIIQDNTNLSKQTIQILSNPISFKQLKIRKLKKQFKKLQHILTIQTFKFILTNFKSNQINSIPINGKPIFGNLISNDYEAFTGGTPYLLDDNTEKKEIKTSFLWIPEESHTVNRDISILKVEEGEYVTEKAEILPNIYSQISGIVQTIQKNNILQETIIKPGFTYKIKNCKRFEQKLYYPGEIIFDNLKIQELSLAEVIETTSGPELLIRPVSLFCIPKLPKVSRIFNKKDFEFKNVFKFKVESHSRLKNAERIKEVENFKLIKKTLNFDFLKTCNNVNQQMSILGSLNSANQLTFKLCEDIFLLDLVPNQLKKSEIKLSIIVKKNQFVNAGTTLGYVQKNATEFVHFIKVKMHLEKDTNLKRLLCIREKDCIEVNQPLLESKKINDIVLEKNILGRIIDKKSAIIFLQQGQPYFFPKNAQLFCKNGDLIEKQQNIGELSFEKEITGDIVQGLPRVEEILESRKAKWKRLYSKNEQLEIPNLLCTKTLKYIEQAVLDGHINLHALLKIYFHWYLKRLNIYEASYRSTKKIQCIILNLIQSVYQSQGVTISDKHLEVIVKQMTTKVKISHEGDTKLLPNELIDLSQIKYINQSVYNQNKKTAFYEPVLLGITKASLNTDSFVSAASFQETTRVLTKAAIEGKVDWLRGLKENVIIGRLIPAGTGFHTSINLANSDK